MAENSITLTWRDIGSVLGLIVLGIFTWFQMKYYVLPEISQISKLSSNALLQELWPLFWPPLVGYLLIGSNICLLVHTFKPLNAWDEDGLVLSLITGLVFGLVAGLAIGMFFGLISGVVDWLPSGLVAGLAFGLVFGLVAGLAIGIIDGLKDELP